MSFIICRRRSDNRHEYFAGSGREKSFTPIRSRAARFTTRQEAERERCPENEWIDTL